MKNYYTHGDDDGPPDQDRAADPPPTARVGDDEGTPGESAGAVEQDRRPLTAIWAEVNAIRGGQALKLTKSRRSSLKARLTEHSAEEVLAVARWVYSSQHERARYLREHGYGPDTWLRPSKFAGYLEHAESEPPKRNGKAQVLPQKAPRKPGEIDLEELFCGNVPEGLL